MILAIIQPSKLEAVKEALAKVEVFRLTAVEVHGFGRDGVRHELRVHPTFPNAPCDQLRVLAAEVQNEHRPLFGGRLRRGQGDDVAHPIPIFCACCSDFPSVLIDGASMISAFWKSWIDS